MKIHVSTQSLGIHLLKSHLLSEGQKLGCHHNAIILLHESWPRIFIARGTSSNKYLHNSLTIETFIELQTSISANLLSSSRNLIHDRHNKTASRPTIVGIVLECRSLQYYIVDCLEGISSPHRDKELCLKQG